MKIWLPVIIAGMLVLCGLQASALPFDLADNHVEEWGTTPMAPVAIMGGDELDQSQELTDWFGPVGRFPWNDMNYRLAQSFTPTKNLLTRVELFIGRNITTIHPYTVAIRDDLNGLDLTTVSVPAEDIFMENFSWVAFDFPDIQVVPGNTYFIVSSTVNVTDNFYGWGMKIGDVYPNGTVYFTIDDEASWIEEPGGDMTFRTYGTDATELDVTITGFIGVSVAVKNVGAIDAVDVEVEMTVSGGILGLVNTTFPADQPLLAPDEVLPLRGVPLGLGPISITVTARAANAVDVTKTFQGVILILFVLIQ